MQKKKLLILALLAGMALSGAAQAALINRGGGMVYDTDFDLTWLADANYAQTSGYDADGRMDWNTANAWANNLVYSGYDDWRLPTALNHDGTDPCMGFICGGSEMGHLFIFGVPNLTLFFQNIQTSTAYWSGTEFAPFPLYAWYFDTFLGYQSYATKSNEFYAWAVRPGDVAVANPVPVPVPVPEPATLLLLGLGLAGLGVMRRRG